MGVGQSGCEPRIEVIAKLQNKISPGLWSGVRVDVDQEVKLL